MSSALILSELDEDDGNTSNEIAAVDITSLTAVLKVCQSVGDIFSCLTSVLLVI